MASVKFLVSVFDRKAQVYGAPVMARTLGDSERQFQDLLSDKDSFPGKHPEDFDLVLVGKFDEDSGVVTPEMHVVMAGTEVQR